MPSPNLARSSSTRLICLLLLSALLVSSFRVVTIAYAATQYTWTGNTPPANLSSAGNWAGNVAPAAGDDLFFPAGVKRKSIKNNYPNQTTFNSLNFSGSGYNLRKNAMGLTGGINTSNATGTNQISLPLRLNGSQTFTSANSGTTLILNGQLNLNGSALTIAGSGNTNGNGLISSSGGITKNGSGTLTLSANNTYTGATTLSAGIVLVNGSQSGSDIILNGGILAGTGTVGAITAAGGAIRPGTSAPGILNSGTVTFGPSTSLIIDVNGTVPGVSYRQLNVNGAVSLGSSLLNASVNFQSSVGDTFTIINNDGGDSVVGTFSGLPEGATLMLGGLPFTISYQGGNGNDVVLTRVTSTSPPPPSISISDVTITEGDSGTTDAIFTLSLSSSSSQTVTVDYETSEGSATTPDDFASVSGTLAFDPDEIIKTITVAVNGDALNEIDETLFLNLRNSTNASLGDAQAQASILNDDAPPALTIENASVTEGNTGTVDAVFAVSLSSQSGQTVTVDFDTADGTASKNPGNDYEGTSGTLSFAPGETDDEVIVAVNGDTDIESDETFFVTLTNQTNSTLANAQGQGTIADDDTPVPTPTPTPTPDPSPTPTPDPSPTPTPDPSPTPTPDPSPTPTPDPSPTPTPDPSPTPTPDPSPTPTPDPSPTPTPDPSPTPTPDPSPTPTPDPSPTPTPDPSPTPTPDPSPVPTPTPEPSPTPTPDPSPTPTPDPSPTPTPEPSPTPTPDPSPTPTPDPSPTPTPDPSPTPTPEPSPTPTPEPSPTPTPEPSPTPTPDPSPTPTPDPSPTPTPDPSPTPTPEPSPSPSPSPTPNSVQFTSSSYIVDEAAGSITIFVGRSGDTSSPASVEYGTFDSTASERPDYTTSLGTLRFAPGETSKSFIVFITDDAHVEGDETLLLTLNNPQGVSLGTESTVTLTVTDNDAVPSQLNPIDFPSFFVRQHYVDFLNREPDPAGLAFWTNEITVCGSNTTCVAERTVNVSAAFFLSIEFQETGYLAYLMQKASFGTMPRYREFLRNSQEIGKDLIVGIPGWEAHLEANKQAFFERWVNRPAFRSLYDGKSDSDYVNTLFDNAAVVDLAAREQMVAGLQAGTETRTSVLRKLTQNQSFSQKELNSAFVLMQYFGYLRRSPDDQPDNNLDGFNFWLDKLIRHNGNFIDAEMVKAFILSIEYRKRFGQ